MTGRDRTQLTIPGVGRHGDRRVGRMAPAWDKGVRALRAAGSIEPADEPIVALGRTLSEAFDAEWQDPEGSRFTLGSLAGRIMPAWAELRGRTRDDAGVVDDEFAALLATYRDGSRPDPPQPR